mmetsp:Transcript_13953/g.30162  ORF Transcript_13953/g.30162 Transcript_13953/m.30162 type:complete len:218 (-) Transcript_13953:791-1444(-)|eukprot:CAMPEP_0202898106 /NCGR_PEP_ID=MMETSP1392-20130828/6709_1 /ASSEMBLY_ACC=CAM_ASM_000868 /TAXON_ID=225041 /ORGANISM="Chlamydomonas chlamydogama, Strain SAG 11-48b" /LENGTH=217 /DNA_ID=CAMNT_0049583947 /DNA_START=150 /DNA_END=803 /DNA_ORIENTATION=-
MAFQLHTKHSVGRPRTRGTIVITAKPRAPCPRAWLWSPRPKTSSPDRVASQGQSNSVSTESGASEGSSDSDEEPVARVAWHEKPCEWKTVRSVAELKSILSENDGRHIALDLFAGWCSSCKAAYPALCKIPKEKEIGSKFRFIKANIEDEDMKEYVKELGVRGIPYLAIYRPGGAFVLGMNAGFKKMNNIKTTMDVIVNNPDAGRFVLNPQGVAEPA